MWFSKSWDSKRSALKTGSILVVALAIVSTLACSSGESDKSQESAGSLVVYSGRSESLVGPIIEQFGEISGIDVKVKYGGTAELAATLREEGDNTPADVFFAQDPGGLGAVKEMLSPLPQDITSLVPEWARASESEWVGISGRARVVVYNTNNVPIADLPAELTDLTDPKWKGRIGWAPANGSFQTMVTAMRSAWGEDITRQFLSDLKANDPKEFPKNTPIVAATAAGEIDVGLVNHYYLHRFIQEDGEDFGARNHFMKGDGPGSLVMVAGAGILKQSDNRENAEKFLRFMESTVAQQYFASQTFEYPLVEGINTHRLLPPIAELNGPDIDVADLVDLAGTQSLLRDLGIIP
jgi:iron(III) transport system substrate-binding protein